MMAEWYGALSLEERWTLLQANPSLVEDTSSRDEEQGRRHLQAWRSQKPFDGEREWLRRRLVSAGMTLEDFERVLRTPPEFLARLAGAPPPWVETLLRAYQGPAGDDLSVPAGLLAQAPELRLLYLVQPLIRLYRERFFAGVEALVARGGEAPFTAERAWEQLSPALVLRLQKMIDKVGILELHTARLRGALRGETPQERFASFIERLRDPDFALRLLREYPVLARKVVEYAEDWCTVSLELLERLHDDWEALCRHFSPEQAPGPLVAIQVGAGDRHRGGRSVTLLTFHSGLKLVYKPRSLAIDWHFQELLAWANARGASPAFRTLELLDRGAYGWVEFVEHQACHSREELERFHVRLGGCLALLHALDATDFHYENLIASGEHPVLVDLESFFAPSWDEDAQPESLAGERELAHSVLRTGMLPFRLHLGRDGEGLDISGMSLVRGVLAPKPSPLVRQAGTDEMRIVYERRPLADGRNRPSLEGTEVSLLDYADAVVQGFDQVYALLLSHREELLAPGGWLARLAGIEVRVLARMTASYIHLLMQSDHPDMLRDGLAQDRHWDHLWVGAVSQPQLERLIPAEHSAGKRSDVPLFTTRVGSTGLWWEQERELPGFFQETGLERVRRRIETLGPEDRKQQVWLIRASLASLQVEKSEVRPYTVTGDGPEAGWDELLAAARAIGDRMAETALRRSGEATWIGMCMRESDTFSLLPLDVDLYSGLSGQALFLAWLGELTGEARYVELARETTVALRRRLAMPSPAMELLGAYIGAGGPVYTLAWLGVLWREDTLLDEAEALVERMAPRIEQDGQLDIIGGTAGWVLALLTLYQHRPSERLLREALRGGEWLLAHAEPVEGGLGWRGSHSRPLTGLSHGAAGFAWALLELAALTGEERFRQAARGALGFERNTFREEVGDWIDLRFAERGGESMVAWCNGAPGLGLSRLRMMRLLDDPALRTEVEAALAVTLARGFGHNHSLCHGDLGNLELLLQAGLHLDAETWLPRARRWSAGILASLKRRGWVCGVPTGLETPGLMTGITGIGYGLLRAAEPRRVPSVLLLESQVPEPRAMTSRMRGHPLGV
jgi:type 2 lantibiotic biosynthesis protein LanM